MSDLTFGLPPSHLGHSSELDGSRFVVGLRQKADPFFTLAIPHQPILLLGIHLVVGADDDALQGHGQAAGLLGLRVEADDAHGRQVGLQLRGAGVLRGPLLGRAAQHLGHLTHVDDVGPVMRV